MKHIEVFENERALYYDNFVQTWILNYQFVIDTIPKIVEIENPNATEILVVGSGTGNELLSLSKQNKPWKITGVDPSPDMVKIAQEKLKKHTQVTIIQGEVNQLPENKKYDVATLLLVLHFMKDDGTKEVLLKDIYDKLETGAPFIILDIFGNKQEFSKNIKLLETILPEEVDGVAIKERIASMPERIYNISEDRLIKILQTVGFSKPIRFFQSAIYGGWITKKNNK